MFSKYKEKRRISADLNMTPMIDIVFQLLTFFMVTSTFIQTSSLNVQLPEAHTSDKIVKQDHVITVYKDGSITWNEKSVSKNDLPIIMKEIKDGSPNPTLTIQGDKNISYGLLIEIMDQARIAKIDQLSLSTVLK
ncbi:MAG: ExbD/TolR family protein [Brevinemataceae bacterium]